MKSDHAITVRNAQRHLPLDRPALQNFAEQALRLCLTSDAVAAHRRDHLPRQIDVLLVSDRRIATLHKKFMSIPGPTDVITFQHGEIFVSVETAKRNARRFQSSTGNEIRLYLVHGLLHLLGFDDKKPAEARRMETMQSEVVAMASASAR